MAGRAAEPRKGTKNARQIAGRDYEHSSTCQVRNLILVVCFFGASVGLWLAILHVLGALEMETGGCIQGLRWVLGHGIIGHPR